MTGLREDERDALDTAVEYLTEAARGTEPHPSDAAATMVNVGDLRRVLRALAARPAQTDAATALDEVERLHTGFHGCRGGYYTDDQPYSGSIAKRGPCPTATAARAALTSEPQP